jgi:hypothetical protein
MSKYIFSLIYILGLGLQVQASDNDFSYKNKSEIRAKDYLYQDPGFQRDPVFDQYRTVDLGVKLGVGSDCGRVDFKSTLQASLKNMLDSKYFGDLGKDIVAGSPMLLACYFSPTWCAILKHSQINANFMGQMRLNQCALMDKYTDSRVEDFYTERQDCVHKEIERNGGNIEAAMQSCNSSRVWENDLTNWAGNKFGEKSDSNKLIESSAKWAGFSSPESSGAVKLVQSLVGDTVVSKGNVSVEYGDKPFGITPRTHLAGIERDIRDKLCVQLLKRIDDSGSSGMNIVVRDSELRDITGGNDQTVLDRQTLRNLAVMPYRARSLYCGRLANSLAMTKFAEDMNRSLDVLSVASQNPNLPEKRRKEIADKRAVLKESVEATIELQKERSAPINEILSQINQEGELIHQSLTHDKINQESNDYQLSETKRQFFDCSDGVLCSRP